MGEYGFGNNKSKFFPLFLLASYRREVDQYYLHHCNQNKNKNLLLHRMKIIIVSLSEARKQTEKC